MHLRPWEKEGRVDCFSLISCRDCYCKCTQRCFCFPFPPRPYLNWPQLTSVFHHYRYVSSHSLHMKLRPAIPRVDFHLSRHRFQHDRMDNVLLILLPAIFSSQLYGPEWWKYMGIMALLEPRNKSQQVQYFEPFGSKWEILLVLLVFRTAWSFIGRRFHKRESLLEGWNAMLHQLCCISEVWG